MWSTAKQHVTVTVRLGLFRLWLRRVLVLHAPPVEPRLPVAVASLDRAGNQTTLLK